MFEGVRAASSAAIAMPTAISVISSAKSCGCSQNSVNRCQRPAISTAFHATIAVGMP